MKKYINIIKNCTIFSGVNDDEIEAMLKCLNAREERFGKDNYILRSGEATEEIGIILSGSAFIIQEDFWGNRNILSNILPSEAFGEAFACSVGAITNVSVAAEESCVVMWLNVGKILTICPSACGHHSKMIRNLLSELAKKNLLLNEKLTHISHRSTREKVLSYLSSQSQKYGRREFDIPFNRQQLADYLSVERSALSAELSKLQREGMIEFEKNRFILKQ